MKKLFVISSLFFYLLTNAQNASIRKKVFKKIDNVTIYDIPEKGVFIFKAGMKIDADGAPKAYHKNSILGLDRLSNAGKPGDWYALETRNGEPIIQKQTDPAPGYYVSTTSLYDRTKKLSDPYRYADATRVPYFVIPKKFDSTNNIKIGDLVLVINTTNNKRCYAIVGDEGNKDEIGECSIYLAKELGVPGTPRSGGLTNGILYILIKNSGDGNGKLYSATEIQKSGKEKLNDETIAELLKWASFPTAN